MPFRIMAKAPVLFAAAAGLSLTGCAGMATNRSLDSIHQPVVQRTNYTLDLASGPSGLTQAEQRRLAGWFEAMDLRYGDKIAIDDPLSSAATRDSIEGIAGRHGLLVGNEVPITSGALSAGTVRVVVSRTLASVPGCPDWSSKSDFNFNNATSSGYGCAVNSNLASMVADPEHLIRGASGTGETVVMSSTKAITSYRDAKPTGEAGLKQTSTEGGK